MTSPRLRLALALLAPIVAAAAALGFVLRSLPDGAGEGGFGVAEPALVFAQFGPTADRVYTVPAVDPARRTLVATVEHAQGSGIVPAPAMAGSLVAYTVLPPASPGRRDEPAELWILDITTSERVRLARDADLLVAPQFDVDGGYLAYRSTGPHGEQHLVRVDLKSRARRVVYTQGGGFGVFPIGFSDGALLFAGLSTAGTDLYRVRDGEDAELLFHASDHVARDWRLSPDGRWLSFLAPELAAERIVHRLHVVSVESAERMSGPGAGGPMEQFSPVWTPAGDAVTVGREAYPALTAAAVTLSLDDGGELALAAPERGFDAPLGWSPDGRYLAARSFDGSGSYEPGRESMVVISIDGVRRAVTAGTELIFLGWLQSG